VKLDDPIKDLPVSTDSVHISIIVYLDSFDNGRLKRNSQRPAPDYQYSSQIDGGGPCVINWGEAWGVKLYPQ